QMAKTISAIADSWSHGPNRNQSNGKAGAGFNLFVPDAFSNPDHLKFAVRACLAAILCYIFYNAVSWPGLNTAVATCLFTALSTIGSSRQKQTLRLAGAVFGGLILGIGSQILVFPRIDSIFEFALLFGLVSILAAWIMAATPRLSYLGLQVAL